MFGHVLHFSPRDVDDLTLSEFEQLTAELDAYVREMKRSATS